MVCSIQLRIGGIGRKTESRMRQAEIRVVTSLNDTLNPIQNKDKVNKNSAIGVIYSTVKLDSIDISQQSPYF